MTIWQDVEALFEGRPEPRLRPIFGKRMYGPATDDTAPPQAVTVPADIEGLTIGILYRDMRGDVSDRVIRCRELRLDNGHYYIDAECLLRHASRTFRLDRIEQVTDYSTGELIANVGGFFAAYIEQPPDDSWPEDEFENGETTNAWIAPTTTNPRIAAAFRDGARVLLYLAMSDGELHESEHDFVVAYATNRLRRIPEPPTDPESIVRRWIDNHVPTRASAFAALGRVCLNDDDGEEIAHAMVDLIIADGTATDGEMAAAWKIVEALEQRQRTRPQSLGD